MDSKIDLSIVVAIGLVAIIIAGMLTNKVTSEHISMVIGAFVGVVAGYGSGKYTERRRVERELALLGK